MRQLEGAYALIFKSPHYPNELIACKRGSTLILGVNVSCIILCMYQTHGKQNVLDFCCFV
jgi:glucosamine 6-phosphate synthetase-like amidotransferase/phosphosugar isomerase protein